MAAQIFASLSAVLELDRHLLSMEKPAITVVLDPMVIPITACPGRVRECQTHPVRCA
jgi:hypothetical protein